MSSLPSSPISQDLATVLEALEDGVVVLDGATRRPVFANESYARLVGFRSANALLHEPDAKATRSFAYLDREGAPLPFERLPHVSALRGERPPPMEVRVRALELGDERWGRLHAIPLKDEQGGIRQVVSIFQMLTGQRRAERTVRFLAEASKVLGVSLDYHSTLQALIRLVVPELADGCSVDIIEDDGSVQRFAGYSDPERDRLANEMRRRFPLQVDARFGPAHVLRTGQPSIVREYTDEMISAVTSNEEHARMFRALGYREGMTVPLSVRGRVIGALSLILCEKGRTFDDQDLALAVELAARAASAVDNARLFREVQRALERKDEEARTSELLRRVGDALAAKLEAGSGMTKLAIDEAITACGASFGAFISPPSLVPHLKGRPIYSAGLPPDSFTLLPPALVEPLWRGEGPVRLADAAADERYRAACEAMGFRSYLAVKVHNGGPLPPSALVLGSPEPGAFTVRHEQLAQALANQLAGGLWNGYLFSQLRAAEAKSRASEERLRLALGAGRMGNFDTDLVTGQTVISPEFEEMLGIPHGSYDGRFESFLDRLHPADREPTARRLDRLVAEGGTSDVADYRALRPDGTIRWIEAHTRILRDESGKALRRIGVVVDITARREAEEKSLKLATEQAARAEAEASEKRITAILNSIGEPLIALDLSWRIRFANRGAEEYLRRPREELLGRNAQEIYPTPLARRLLAECERARRESTIVTFEYTSLAGNAMELRACPYDAGVSVYLRDITVHRRAQEAEARRARYEALRADVSMALADQGSLVATLDQCAHALARHLGVELTRVWMLEPAGELMELVATSGDPAGAAPGQRIPIPPVLLTSGAHERRTYVTNALASSSYIEPTARERLVAAGFSAFAGCPLTVGDQLLGLVTLFSTKPIPDDLPQALSAIADAMAQGIRRRRAEQDLALRAAELARSNTELEQFAYVASHDLQEPLRMVSSYTQLLARRYRGKLDADADEFINFAVDGVNRMKRLISDLLAYSRVGTKGKELVPTALEPVMEHVLDNLQAAIHDTGAQVTCTPLPQVLGDDVQLEQLFQNLIGNALKFHGDAAPRIHVSAERHGSEWRFSVKDNGIGIEPQYFEKIFILFQRLHGKEQYSGTGIGLAVCKKIVERHGGRIWVESRPGQGSTFFFTLKPVESSSRSRTA